MPKMKTHKAGAKRYRVTGTGKIMRFQAGRGHLNQKKSSRRKSNLDHYLVIDDGNLRKVRAQLPYPQYSR
jgi:large subunit ribosomal protein L35